MRLLGVIIGVLFCLTGNLSAGDTVSAGSSGKFPHKVPGNVLVLCYHSVRPWVPSSDDYSITRSRFVEQMAYLRAHGYRPVSVREILDAAEKGKPLPEKPVLLTFDDAYRSFHEIVLPVLKQFGYPAMLAVVGAWIEGVPPGDLPEPLMTWEEIREAEASGLVEVASHSFDLHRAVRYTPQGNRGAAVSVRIWDPATGYETETAYRARLDRDFREQEHLFRERTGRVPRALVWPYGRFNALSTALAREKGFRLLFTLEEGFARTGNPWAMNRVLVRNAPMDRFISALATGGKETPLVRAAQVDLDLMYDPSPEQTDRNLGHLIERLLDLGVNTVFLQAFADPQGTGTVGSVYFENRVLPVRADIFAHAAHQIMIRGIQVYAWMPALAVRFPDPALTAGLRVRETAGGEIRESRSWYERLTPFSPAVRDRMRMLYEDLAVRAQIHGILFQDDAYLTDLEDVHPEALAAFSAASGRSVTPEDIGKDPVLAREWAAFKTDALIAFTRDLSKEVSTWRPEARFTRNLYAEVLADPAAGGRFAQDYGKFLEAYDYVTVMAYPRLENASRPREWLEGLVRGTDRFPGGIGKTVFKLQTYDWRAGEWVTTDTLLSEMRAVLAAGGRHLAYYPDNLFENRPDSGLLRLEMSDRAQPRETTPSK